MRDNMKLHQQLPCQSGQARWAALHRQPIMGHKTGDTLRTGASVPWIEVGLGFVNNEPTKKNIQKSSLTYIPTTLYVELTQALFIDLSEIVKFVKASTFVISAHLKISTLFVISRILRAKVSPEWRLNPGFGTQKKCLFPLNRGVYPTEIIDTKIMWTFFRGQILCPLEVCLPKERFLDFTD